MYSSHQPSFHSGTGNLTVFPGEHPVSDASLAPQVEGASSVSASSQSGIASKINYSETLGREGGMHERAVTCPWTTQGKEESEHRNQ